MRYERIQAQGLYVRIWTKLYTFIRTLTIYTTISKSGNVSMPIKFNFMICSESIQTIFNYVSRLLIDWLLHGTSAQKGY